MVGISRKAHVESGIVETPTHPAMTKLVIIIINSNQLQLRNSNTE